MNRVKDVSKTAGGKGLNVTRVLYESGDKVTATGFLGGKIGEFMKLNLRECVCLSVVSFPMGPILEAHNFSIARLASIC